jgi:hypothetical protein
MLQTNIDGNLLKITDFSMGLIPPPMCHYNADFDDNREVLLLLVDAISKKHKLEIKLNKG